MSKRFSNHGLVQDDYFDFLPEDEQQALRAEISNAFALDGPPTDEEIEALYHYDELRHYAPLADRHMYSSH